MYYNNDKKQEYLALLDKNATKILKGIFNGIKEYEEKLDKDIGFFTKNEIKELYKECGYSRKTMVVYNGKLKKYAHWINHKSIGFDLMTSKDFDEICGIPVAPKKQINIYKTDKHHIISLNDVINGTDELKNAVDQFLLYGLFCGIKGNAYEELEYSSMEASDPNTGMIWLAKIKDNGDIELKSRKFYADKKLFTFAQEACESEFYYQYCKNGRINKNPVQKEGRRIVKLVEKKGETDKENKNITRNKRIQLRLINIISSSKYLYGVSPLSIFWSGFIYNIRKVALENGISVPDATDALQLIKDERFKPVFEQYGSSTMDYNNLRNNLERYK